MQQDNNNATSTAIITHNTGSALLAYADAMAPRTIVGSLVKFVKGDFFVGEDGEPLAEGTVFTVNLDELMAGWVHWEGGQPTEHIMVRVADGRPSPKRSALGDIDEANWEIDSTGNPRDPWQFTNYAPMLDEAGNLYTFATSSRGGLAAIGDLIRVYVASRKMFPDDHLMVKLEVGSYAHKNRAYGRIKVPKFTPVGHTPKASFDAALMTAGVPVAERAVPKPALPIEIELNDSIPDFGEEPPPANLADFQ
jgi:hypothetical protein